MRTREQIVADLQTTQERLEQLKYQKRTIEKIPGAVTRGLDEGIAAAQVRISELTEELRQVVASTQPSSLQRPAGGTRRRIPVSTPTITSSPTTTTTSTTPSPQESAGVPTVAQDANTSPAGISPYITTIESFHPKIQYELLRRTKSSEMATVYMPFVKLTSLSTVLGDNLSEGRRCQTGDAHFPSLGIHGEQDISFDDIYNPTTGNRSIIGYATPTSPLSKRIPVLVSTDDVINEPPNIPMPGIVGLQTERTTAGPMGVRGGLFKATLNIKAYSTGQVNALLRYFLRPATRVVLELGHQPANAQELDTILDEYGVFQKFNWNRSKDLIDLELEPLVSLKASQRQFIEKYIYGNFGNYEIFIGYVVDFKLKYGKDNLYNIDLIIHSLQQFEVPLKSTAVESLNQGSAVESKCKVVEITDYFNENSGFKLNSFPALMKNALTPDSTRPIRTRPLTSDNWGQHIIPLRGVGSSPGAGGNQGVGYLVSWEFFVNVILNDLDYGILNIFKRDGETLSPEREAVLRSSVLRRLGSEGQLGRLPVVSLNSGEVAWSRSLRSTDPNVMVIYNSSAQEGQHTEDTVEIVSKLERLGIVKDETIAQDIISGFTEGSQVKLRIVNSPVGSFSPVEINSNVSYLTKGVWINTNAIVQAFQGADTVSSAINSLLTLMNNATKGFWNLQLLSNDTEHPGMHVIDAGLSKNIKQESLNGLTNQKILDENILGSISNFNEDLLKLGTRDEKTESWIPKYLYLFNRGVSSRGQYDTGGELLDVSLESSLPQVIAIQAIAGIGGQMQRGALEAIDINELRKITAYPGVYPPCKSNGDTDVCPEPTIEEPRPPNDMPASIVNTIVDLIKNGRRTPGASINARLERTINSYVGICPEPITGPNGETTNKTAIESCERQNEQQRIQAEQYVALLQNTALESSQLNRSYLNMVGAYGAQFGSVLDLIEYNTSRLAKNLDIESTRQEVHPFNSSNLTKTTVDLTLPGIGGIQLFQSFGVLRVPNILNRGYYIVTKVSHEFSESGWITKIQGRFRYRPNLDVSGQQQVPCNPPDGTCAEPS